MPVHRSFPAPAEGAFLPAAVAGGLVAGVLSTLVQIVLWILFTHDFPGILWRDGRLTAALLLGPQAPAPASLFDWTMVMAIAGLIHFGLSILYAAILYFVTRSLDWPHALLVGALLGLLLYLVNLYGFALLFPWFSVARGNITLAAHLAFGLSAVAGGRWWLARRPPGAGIAT